MRFYTSRSQRSPAFLLVIIVGVLILPTMLCVIRSVDSQLSHAPAPSETLGPCDVYPPSEDCLSSEAATGGQEKLSAAPCIAEELREPAEIAASDGDVILSDMDPTGRFIVGAKRRAGGSDDLILWDHGVPQLLTVPGFAAGMVGAGSVNEHGSVAGEILVNGRVPGWRPWVLHQGAAKSGTESESQAPVLRMLPMPGGGEAVITSINARGDIAGSWSLRGETMGGIAWLVNANGGYTPRTLPGHLSPKAFITDAGTVVGSGRGSFGPYIWSPDETVRFLPVPDGETSQADVRSVRGEWAVGRILKGAVRWNLRTDEVESMMDGLDDARVINSQGDVVGDWRDGTPVLVRNGRPVALPHPPMPPEVPQSERKKVIPVAISDDATMIVANYTFSFSLAKERILPTLWRCRY